MLAKLLMLALLGQSPPIPGPDSLPPPAAAAESNSGVDEGDVPPPPPMPTPRATPLIAQQPPRPVHVSVTQDAPQAGPAASDAQHVVVHVVVDRPQPTPGTPYATPQAQAQYAAPELVPTAAVVTTTSRVHHPGWLRRSVGQLGQRLAEVGKPWTRIPPATAVVTQAVHQVAVQQPTAAAERVYASPQGSR